jgi:hypothetical protein
MSPYIPAAIKIHFGVDGRPADRTAGSPSCLGIVQIYYRLCCLSLGWLADWLAGRTAGWSIRSTARMVRYYFGHCSGCPHYRDIRF